jgi:hypothetical protein
VHLSNQVYDERGTTSPEEKAAKHRIYQAALAAGLKTGSVCVYLLAPNGRPVATAPLNEDVAADPQRLAELMQQVVQKLQVTPGGPVVTPKPPMPPQHDAEDLFLHLVARYLCRLQNQYVPCDVSHILGTKQAGSWSAIPSEEWIILRPAQWRKLLPPGPVQSDTRWTPDRQVLAQILQHFYPPTENTDLMTNRITEQVLSARVVGNRGKTVQVYLEGRLRMKHPFYHQDDNNHVEALLIGYMEFDADGRRIRSLQLVTDNGHYGGEVNGVQPFGAAVRQVLTE